MVDDPSQRPLERPVPRPEKPRLAWLSLALASLGLIAACVVLIFLTLGVFGPVLLIGVVLLLLVLFHFVVWGWWLGRIIRNEEEEEMTKYPTTKEARNPNDE